MQIDDYILWKTWWIAVLYGASAEMRMALMDRIRSKM